MDVEGLIFKPGDADFCLRGFHCRFRSRFLKIRIDGSSQDGPLQLEKADRLTIPDICLIAASFASRGEPFSPRYTICSAAALRESYREITEL